MKGISERVRYNIYKLQLRGLATKLKIAHDVFNLIS